MESFAAANKALAFFDTAGELNAVDMGKYLMALVNHGTALAVLGCFSAALEALSRAKEVFSNSNLDPVRNKSWLDMVEGNILAINSEMVKRQG
jgi:hypothetical protein